MSGRNVNDDPALRDLVHNFEDLLTHIVGPQNGRNGPPLGGSIFPFPGQRPNHFAHNPFPQPPLQGGYGGFMTFEPDGRMRPVRGNIPDNGNMQE